MDFVTIFDIVIAALVLMLGIKGIMNGLIREVFGLIGLIGGIILASRFANEAGKLISEKIYKIDNESIVFFIGFLSVLIVFWVAAIAVGAFLYRLAGLSGLGFLDRLGGFIIGSLKIFLIFSVLMVTISNIGALNAKLKPYLKDSILYPVLIQAGQWIMNVDVGDMKQKLEKQLEAPFAPTIQEKKEPSSVKIEVKEDINKTIETTDINNTIKFDTNNSKE